MEKHDYEHWKMCMESLVVHPITNIITKDNFDKFVELHYAIKFGDRENIARLTKELNFKFGNRRGDVS